MTSATKVREARGKKKKREEEENETQLTGFLGLNEGIGSNVMMISGTKIFVHIDICMTSVSSLNKFKVVGKTLSS